MLFWFGCSSNEIFVDIHKAALIVFWSKSMIRFVLLFALFCYFWLELAAFSAFAGHVGLLGCFVEIIVSLIVGARILGSQPREMLQALQSQVSSKSDPRLLLLGGLRLLFAGFLLVLPGLLTDMIGLWLWISSLLLRSSSSRQQSSTRSGENSVGGQGFQEAWQGNEFDERLKGKARAAGDSDIVDATIISDEDKS